MRGVESGWQPGGVWKRRPIVQLTRARRLARWGPDLRVTGVSEPHCPISALFSARLDESGSTSSLMVPIRPDFPARASAVLTLTTPMRPNLHVASSSKIAGNLIRRRRHHYRFSPGPILRFLHAGPRKPSLPPPPPARRAPTSILDRPAWRPPRDDDSCVSEPATGASTRWCGSFVRKTGETRVGRVFCLQIG